MATLVLNWCLFFFRREAVSGVTMYRRAYPLTPLLLLVVPTISIAAARNLGECLSHID
jgi:hypothetical protein